MRLVASLALFLSLLLLQGCAQYWTDTTGAQRGQAEFVADSKQCELEVFGTTDWNEARADALAKFSSGRRNQADYSLEYEHYATCVEHAGWVMKQLEKGSAAPGA